MESGPVNHPLYMEIMKKNSGKQRVRERNTAQQCFVSPSLASVSGIKDKYGSATCLYFIIPLYSLLLFLHFFHFFHSLSCSFLVLFSLGPFLFRSFSLAYLLPPFYSTLHPRALSTPRPFTFRSLYLSVISRSTVHSDSPAH